MISEKRDRNVLYSKNAVNNVLFTFICTGALVNDTQWKKQKVGSSLKVIREVLILNVRFTIIIKTSTKKDTFLILISRERLTNKL